MYKSILNYRIRFIRIIDALTTIHFGTTTDYKKRYKVNTDETKDKK